MVYDPLYRTSKDKPAANPRYEAFYNVLGRVNIKLLTGNFDSGNSAEKDETSVEENSDTFSDLVPILGELTKGMQEVDKEGMDVPDHEVSSSSEARATAGQHRYTHSKSGGIRSKKTPTAAFSEANCELENYRCSSENTCG
jgi:hypothetical protein